MLEIWCHEFLPDTFSEQTAATFSASLRGRAAARAISAEQDTILAWKTGAFAASAQAGKLKKLDHYLSKVPIRLQTDDEIAAIFKSLKAQGKSVRIRARPKGQLLQ